MLIQRQACHAPTTNAYPERLLDELNAARRAEVAPVEVTSDNLGGMAAKDKRMIYTGRR